MFPDAVVTGVRRTGGKVKLGMFWIYLLAVLMMLQPHQESLPKHLRGCPDFDCPGDCRFFRWALTLAPTEGFPGAKALQFLIVFVLI